jgi:hypothetical protein
MSTNNWSRPIYRTAFDLEVFQIFNIRLIMICDGGIIHLSGEIIPAA